MKRLLLLASILLLGLTPAQKRVVLNQFSESQCDNIIRAAGPTLWLDAEYGITATATNTVSTWASRVGAVTFTQATAGNQPSLAGPDGRENRVTNSEDWDNATYYTPANAAISGTTLTAAAGNSVHRITAATGNFPSGEPPGYRGVLVFDIAYNNYQYAAVGNGSDADWHSAVVDLNAGTITACAAAASTTCAIETIGTKRYKVTISEILTTVTTAASRPYVTLAKDQSSYRNDTAWNAAGTEALDIYSVAVRSSLADPTYIATTTYPIYRGLNGRRAVRFATPATMTSTSTLDTVFNNNAKTYFAALRLEQLATTGTSIVGLSNAGTYFGNRVSTTALGVLNYDGSDDVAEITPTLNRPYVISATHNGATLAASYNGANVSVASGNTSQMTGMILLGPATGTGYGTMSQVVTFDKVLGSDTIAKINRCLCRKAGASC